MLTFNFNWPGRKDMASKTMKVLSLLSCICACSWPQAWRSRPNDPGADATDGWNSWDSFGPTVLRTRSKPTRDAMAAKL